MRRNPINFLYDPGHVSLWCVEVGPVANARESSKQEHDWARMKLLHIYNEVLAYVPLFLEEGPLTCTFGDE